MNANSLMVLHPYWKDGFWVFDDSTVDLVAEPFVAGIPEILERIIDREGFLPYAREAGFALVFSASPFPGHLIKLTLSHPEAGGNWYDTEIEGEKMTGWLCPALFKYFPVAPKEIYIFVKPR